MWRDEVNRREGVMKTTHTHTPTHTHTHTHTHTPEKRVLVEVDQAWCEGMCTLRLRLCSQHRAGPCRRCTATTLATATDGGRYGPGRHYRSMRRWGPCWCMQGRNVVSGGGGDGDIHRPVLRVRAAFYTYTYTYTSTNTAVTATIATTAAALLAQMCHLQRHNKLFALC